MPDFKAEMQQIQFRLRLRWEELTALAGLRGPTSKSKRKGGERRGEEGRGGEGEGRGEEKGEDEREGEGEGRGVEGGIAPMLLGG